MSTPEERAEYARLLRLKAWGARYFELHHKLSNEATDAWRKADVFGDVTHGDDGGFK